MAKNVKSYEKSGEKSFKEVAEPIAIYGNIDALKETLIGCIRRIDNIDEVKRLIHEVTDSSDISEEKLEYLREEYDGTHSRPCAYTLDELHAHLDRSMKDIATGHVYTQEEVLNQSPLKW